MSVLAENRQAVTQTKEGRARYFTVTLQIQLPRPGRELPSCLAATSFGPTRAAAS
jgi:hypothetical protein